MSKKPRPAEASRVFGLQDWVDWLGHMANRLFGLTAAEFEAAYRRGDIHSPSADDVGSVLPIIDRLREQKAAH